MESGEKSKLVLCLFHKRFRVLLCADQMGGGRGPPCGQWTNGSREIGVVRSMVPGAVILSRHHECSDSLWESLVHLEYFLKNLKGKAPHSSILTWRIPGMCSPWGRKESDMTERFSLPMETELGV